MDVRGELIRKMAASGIAPIDVIEEVIGWSFYQANKATLTHREVEITGLGTFGVSKQKMRDALDELPYMLANTRNKGKREQIEDMIKYLESKYVPYKRIPETDTQGDTQS